MFSWHVRAQIKTLSAKSFSVYVCVCVDINTQNIPYYSAFSLLSELVGNVYLIQFPSYLIFSKAMMISFTFLRYPCLGSHTNYHFTLHIVLLVSILWGLR